MQKKRLPVVKNGFTLIEILVAMVAFLIVITGALNLFSSAFKYQKQNIEQITLLNSASYVTEYMSRALRMAKKDLNATCIAQNHNFELVTSEHIKFLNDDNVCQEFYVENQVLKVSKGGVSQPLTPADISVQKLEFQIQGESQTDNFQPKVTFLISLKKGEKELTFQTTVSQRDLDVEY